MYPEHPNSPSDLVPLPQCDGPKLKPFHFEGPRSIEFLEFAGSGLHSYVFKVKIGGETYALKLFRFGVPDDWGMADWAEDAANIKAAYPYVDSFNAECRAFGRLQESGREDLAVKCYGYVLLSDEEERAVMDQFAKNFKQGKGMDGSEYSRLSSGRDIRDMFPCSDGRPAPVRCILKEYGQVADDSEETKALTVELADKIFGDLVELHQLGICGVDIGLRQYVNGKLADFSTAMTVPHFAMNPELNPSLPASAMAAMEEQLFQITVSDFLGYDSLLMDHPSELGDRSKSLWAFSNGQAFNKFPALRSTETRDRVYTHVDPRRYDWKKPGPSSSKQLKRRLRRTAPKARRQRLSRLIPQVPRWYLTPHARLKTAKEVKKLGEYGGFRDQQLLWSLHDGNLYPWYNSWRTTRAKKPEVLDFQ